MNEKKITAGKWMGVVAFLITVIVLFGLIIGYVLQAIRAVDVGINISQIVNLASLLFVVVWGAVFGSGITKKIVGNREYSDRLETEKKKQLN